MESISLDITVLLMGKIGTGKELITKAICDNSSRKNNRMPAVNFKVTA